MHHAHRQRHSKHKDGGGWIPNLKEAVKAAKKADKRKYDYNFCKLHLNLVTFGYCRNLRNLYIPEPICELLSVFIASDYGDKK